jgi:hypothetical protein
MHEVIAPPQSARSIPNPQPKCLVCGAALFNLGGFARCTRCNFTICESCDYAVEGDGADDVDDAIADQRLTNADTKNNLTHDH